MEGGVLESYLADHNWNMFASSLIIEICRRFGSDTFFVSPGYRDAPFIAALQLHKGLTLVSCWDERAAAFQALGWAKAKRKPAVLICTSGTAGANYLPAVIEAKTDHHPLLVITADRPFELVFATAQQVIDQRDLFGKFVKKSLDFPAPSPQLNAKAWMSYIKMLLETTTDGYAGPVHLNLPFTAPLDPEVNALRPSNIQVAEAEAAIDRLSFDTKNHSITQWDKGLTSELVDRLKSAKRGLLLIGRLQSDTERKAVALLRDRLGYPVFADIGSGLKFESRMEIPDLNLPQSQQWIDLYAPDCVLHVGKRLVTRHFDDRLARWKFPDYWVLSDEEQIQDPYHLPQRRQYRPDYAQLLAALPMLPYDRSLEREIRSLQRSLGRVKSPGFNFHDVAKVIRQRTRSELFLGNSTAIRAFDSWCFGCGGPSLEVAANRGVSGIEGLLATTIGLSLATRKMWTLVVGDIALLHDLNSIISLAQSEAKVRVVVVNNVGGRIFETLPLQKYPWVKDPLISTPHDFDFKGVAAMARLPYQLAETAEDFTRAYEAMLELGESCIIECKQDAEADLMFSRALAAQEIHYE
ncbi:MAG: 2-succinyl-5-enolpyruvyl-6-hydroxy-3-cyclohexene-1-carboxylic-acid synthase [Chitinophagaceae bacterium]|nr:2-succinyl-5-enolpyruvyl-6-hydroxy-3-cyclohexene-1-carboxylic-acid synthase [Oligoflexus sp.]